MAFRTNKTPVLQEKSASGAVATFNTALAMPLPSCNIAVNAWREGSGDPSPSNVRPIHGFSEVNATKAGDNQFDISNQTGHAYLTNTGVIVSTETSTYWNLSDFQPIKPNAVYHFNPNSTSGNAAKHGYYDKNKNFIGYTSSGEQTFTTPSNAYYMRFSYRTTSTDIMLNFGSTALPYEPYVTPTIYPIQLGQEVYGAEVDVVNGALTITHGRYILDGSVEPTIANWRANADSVGCYWQDTIPAQRPTTMYEIADIIADKLKSVSYETIYSNHIFSIAVTANSLRSPMVCVRFEDTSLTTQQAVCDYLHDNPITIVYKLITPIEIQLTPQQIETLIGNNTIFADTGDIDLTYKDLDIAKRGNFREVFKLPS